MNSAFPQSLRDLAKAKEGRMTSPTNDWFSGVHEVRNPSRPSRPAKRRIIGPDGWTVIIMIWAGVLLTVVGFKVVDVIAASPFSTQEETP